jgi:hypothetical protein
VAYDVEANEAAIASVREEAELRTVCVLFITPMMPTHVTGDEDHDSLLFSLLNDVLNVTTRELSRFQGHLRQYIVDDKGETERTIKR